MEKCKHDAELKKLCSMVMNLNHMGVQSDNIHYCEEMHQTIRELDKIDGYKAVRLLMHIIHVQQLQLVGAKIEYDSQNPFVDMLNFNHIEEYVKHFSPSLKTLY